MNPQNAEEVTALIMSATLVKLLQERETTEIIMTHGELEKIIAEKTVRLEVMSPQSPTTSSIKISVVSVDDAAALVKAMMKAQPKKKER